MKRSDLIDMLNKDLANEYTHMLFYLHHAALVSSLHRIEVREFLLEEAASEMKHVDEFAQVIVGLEGIPVMEINSFPTGMDDPHAILSQALEMEDEVAANYAKRMHDLDTIAENHPELRTDASYMHVFYEDNIRDSRKAADELRQTLKNVKRKDV